MRRTGMDRMQPQGPYDGADYRRMTRSYDRARRDYNRDYADMARRNRMDRADMNRMDTRNPYGSRGGYVTSGRGRRDRAMSGGDYNYDMERDNRYGDRERSYGDSNYDSREYQDSRDYRDMERNSQHFDGHTYYPIEVMGRFEGYYGDGSYPYDMNSYDRMYDMRERDYSGDYGETLTEDELENWEKMLLKEVDEKDKNFFEKNTIAQKAKQLGIQMKEFNEQELAVATLMMYTDYCKALKPYVGANMDVYIKMAEGFLTDPDASVKGAEKLTVYHDCIVKG